MRSAVNTGKKLSCGDDPSVVIEVLTSTIYSFHLVPNFRCPKVWEVLADADNFRSSSVVFNEQNKCEFLNELLFESNPISTSTQVGIFLYLFYCNRRTHQIATLITAVCL